jgi:uncharacterized membrane protein HdeD (DUF308 family)
MDASSYWGWFAESGSGLLPRNWGWFLLRGLLALALGSVAIFAPAIALSALTLTFAAFALVDGLSSIAAGVRGARRASDRWWELVLRGAVGMAIAAVFVAAPAITVISYPVASLILLSAWSIATGTFEITAAVRLRREIRGEWLLALSGILSILLGIAVPLMLLLYPAAAILSVGWMIGIYALAAGFVLVALALRLRARRQPHLAMWRSKS